VPDLTTHTARWCRSNEYVARIVGGSRGEVYHLTYSRNVRGPYQYNWECECKSFTYKGTCKHIDKAEEERCSYGWEALAGSPIEMGKICPECGNSTEVVEYAV